MDLPGIKKWKKKRMIGFLLCCSSVSAFAQGTGSALSAGDTAWMLTAMALVLFMTLPGLALFYAGLVRSKNVLSVLMQCFSITALISVLWVIFGYSLSFDGTGMVEGVTNWHSFLGAFGKVFSRGVTVDSISVLAPTIPETVYYGFQLTFAIITPALIIGAFAERMKFSAMLWFMGLWFTLVYIPICHMVWGGAGSFLGGNLGVLDFAGGIVVHISAGVAALLCAIFLGKRRGYGLAPMPPHNLAMTVAGASMLWVGWFGFNAGSACGANGAAGMATLVTHLSAAVAALVWMGLEWNLSGKPSVLGMVTGAVAGLASVTPASGYCGPMGAILIGVVSSVGCFFASTTMKRRFGYDDSLDAFGVHGVGGFIGSILTGVVASDLVGGSKAGLSIFHQVWIQGIGVGITIVYCGVVTLILLKSIDVLIGLRVEPEAEEMGLDLSDHGENAYNV